MSRPFVVSRNASTARKGRPGKTRLAFLWLVCSLLAPAVVSADGISGSVELNYSREKTEIEDANGFSTERKIDSFLHRYFLTLDKTLYPNLKFMASGTFDQNISKDKTDGEDLKSTTTTAYGLLDLKLSTQFISSGVGYTWREEKQSVSGQPSATQVMETYSANLGLRPEGLPQTDMLFLRTDLHDKERVSQDTLTDFASLGMRYEPYRNLDLRGLVSLTNQEDKLQDLDIDVVNYSARATYSRQFGERVSTYAAYTFFRQETTTSAGGTGEVLFQLFPFSGLSSNSDIPALVTLDQNFALIDGDLTTSAGINLGTPPPGGDVRLRNIGLDFGVPSEVNTVFFWVDRDLPASVSNAFSWDIYTSSDNLNWTLLQTVSSAPFATFFNRFEISFRNVSTRFIKVVTRPLSPAVIAPPGTDVRNIFVTEMQAFLKSSAEEARGKTTQMSNIYDLNVKWRILDRPNLFYDLYFWGADTQPGGTRYFLSNALNVTHRFNRVFSGSARLAYEEIKEATGRKTAAVYSTSVTAVPLPTLFHSLVVSGRFESGEAATDTNSAFLNNSAALYKGLTFNLSGGVSLSTTEEGRKTVNTIINTGLTALPNPALNLNMNYSETNSKQTGGGQDDTTTFTRRGDVSVSFTPFNTLYLYASYGVSAQTDSETIYLQNYAVTWSPFQAGDLQFNFSYNETINSDNVKERTVTPSLRWYIGLKATLDLSYTITNSTVLDRSSDTKVVSAILRITI